MGRKKSGLIESPVTYVKFVAFNENNIQSEPAESELIIKDKNLYKYEGTGTTDLPDKSFEVSIDFNPQFDNNAH